MDIKNYKTQFILTIAIVFSLVSPELYAQELQKLIILPFRNIDRDPNYQYLETSITDAVREKLRARFAFSETSEREWKSVVKKNYLFEDDAFTTSFGLNLGMISGQDVIINGGYYVKTAENDQSSVMTIVRIISVTEKKVISEISIDLPANNELFKKIDDVAEKAAKEASKVLPNKEDWEKSKTKIISQKKLFSKISLGIRGGANFYFEGWADQFSPKLPALSLLLRANMPIIWDKLFLQLNLIYFTHELNPDAQDANYFLANGLTLSTTNYVAGGYFGIDFPIGEWFFLVPKLGGGMNIQNTQVSGSISQSVSNYFPYAAAGFDFGFIVNDTLQIVLDAALFAEIEDPIITYMPALQLGVNLSF